MQSRTGIKNILISNIQYFFNQNNLIRVKMPLPYFDFGNGASCNIAAVEL